MRRAQCARSASRLFSAKTVCNVAASNVLVSRSVQRAPHFEQFQTPIVKRNFHQTAANRKIIPFLLADIGEGITQVELKEWLIQEGQPVKQFQNVARVESDKATVEISSRYDGIVAKLHYKVGDVAKVGAPLLDVQTSDSAGSEPETKKPVAAPAALTPAASTSATSPAASLDAVEASILKVLTTPAVRRIARESRIDLLKVQPTGPKGRLLKEDLLNYIKNGGANAVQSAEAVSAAPAVAPIAPAPVTAEDRVEPVKGITRAMIKSMTASLTVPHLGFCDEYNTDKLIEFRKLLKHTNDDKKVKITYMPIIIKAISLALKQYPILNSQLSADQSQIIYKAAHNIGIAMDTPQGLIVPNIKNVESKSILEIAQELTRLMDLGASGKLGVNDLKGGTFSISNVGVIGGTYASPVIVPPEVCIGAIGKMQKVPRFDKEDNVVAVHIMTMSWSADHRIVDGASIARFSNLVKQYIEEPASMLMHAK